MNTIKNSFLPFDSSKYNKEFKIILNSFSSENKLSNKEESLLWKAYNVGLQAHDGQKRKSGKKYFDHCIEVCIQLINWNMDLNTIIAGLLHDTIEDTELTFFNN